MKTAEEILKETSEYNKWLSELSCSEEITLLDMMKEYAIEVAKEALKNASNSFFTSHEENKLDNVFTAINVISSETNIPKI